VLDRLKDVFASFQKHDVRYVVIGGVASVLYGVPRATFDLDILIKADLQNSTRLLDALLASHFATAALTTPEELLKHEITIFEDRTRIDVQTSTPGLTFDDAWENRITMDYHGQSFYVVSKDDLIKSKSAAGREIDLEDVQILSLGEQ
jgi:hypothetical protein